MADKTIDADDIFDLDGQPTSSEQKSLAYIIFQAIRTNQLEMHTAFPAKVTKVEVTSSLVSIQPMLKRRFIDGKVMNLPIIQNVPVIMPNGFAYSIRVPVKVGDTGLAMCSERSMDVWKLKGGEVDPQDSRLHNLSDAVFIPGLYPMNDPVSIQGGVDSIALVNLLSLFAIQPGGQFLLQNKTSGAELFDLLSQILQKLIDMNVALSTTTVQTVLGPQPLSSAATFAGMTGGTGAFGVLKTAMDTLKGTP